MAKGEQGYSLLSVIIILTLMGVMAAMGLKTSTQLIEQVKFEKQVEAVAHGIEMMKHYAVRTQKQYNVCCLENRILLRQGINKPMKTIRLGENIKIPDTKELTGDELRFKYTNLPSKGGTIVIEHKTLKRKALIKVGAASGRVRIVYKNV